MSAQFVNLVALSLEKGHGWCVTLESPEFVDGSRPLIRMSAGGPREHVLVDGPRAPQGKPNPYHMGPSRALLILTSLVNDGWQVAPPWVGSLDAEAWLMRKIGAATCRLCSVDDITNAIVDNSLSRWEQAEAVLSPSRVTATFRVDRLSMWREPYLRPGVWVATREAAANRLDDCYTLARFSLC